MGNQYALPPAEGVHKPWMNTYKGPDYPHPKIPDYRSFKIEEIPELLEFRKQLEKEGLKDPWMR